MNRKNEPEHRIRRALRTLLFAVLATVATTSEAALLNLADAPLYLSTPVEPNIILTFDDSGSMAWGYLGDSVGAYSNYKRGCAAAFNGVAYNPSITYTVPVANDGTPLFTGSNVTSFTHAFVNGYYPTGQWLDLSSSTLASSQSSTTSGTGYRVKWTTSSTGASISSTAACTTGNNLGQPAFYFLYDTTLSGCTGSITNESCYKKVTVSATSGPGGTDERQNFANWFSYYSTRNLMAKTAAGRAFSRFGSNVRVTGQHLNNTTAGSGSTIKFTTTITTLKEFTGSDRTDFFTRLYNTPAANSTPLRQAVQRAGNYLSGSTSQTNGSYRDNPSAPLSSVAPVNQERSCRQNFQVVITDGFWNGTAGVSTNVDGSSATFPDGTAYSPGAGPTYAPPYAVYADSTSATLADNTFYYWSNDLRTDLTNNVPAHLDDTSTGTSATNKYWNPRNDPATWQHLVTYTIGLGLVGTLDFNNPATYSGLLAGTISWPAAVGDTATAVDDLWHAAIDSRGRYFSAGNPDAVVSAFNAIVNEVLSKTASSASASMNTASVSSSSVIYQSIYNSGTWEGQLLAYPFNTATGAFDTTAAWDAGAKLNNQDGLALSGADVRQIVTAKPSTGKGIKFRWPANPAAPGLNELDLAQVTALDYNPVTAATDTQGSARLDYLRGDASNEGTGNNYRPRTRSGCSGTCTSTGVLGDTVDSAPVLVGAPSFYYPDNLESSTPTAAQKYSVFASTWANRTPMIYVGANDGMLHGFDATVGTAGSGKERIAYVPSSVYSSLSALTNPSYTHKFYVDGNAISGDAYLGSTYGWRTLLVGGLRKGGQGMYALDITDPSQFQESNAANLLLWEFTDANDADLGYTYSDPVIVKTHNNGEWAVIFGNGYNNTAPDGHASTTGDAVLYVLFIEQGADGTWAPGDFVKIDTGVGTSTDPSGKPNGLASPAVVDVDGDLIADYVYAGDLQGNMWRFDITSATDSSWTSASSRTVIYQARDALNNPQPITTKPAIGFQPAGLSPQNGAPVSLMIYFGTGKYLETGDASTVGATTQTFYGIWDGSGYANPNRSMLLQQTTTSSQTSLGINYRVTSNNPMVWKVGSTPPSPSYVGWYMDLPTTGERIAVNPVLLPDRIEFASAIPSDDPCVPNGSGWLFELDPASGGRLDSSPFDVNGDGVINANDGWSLGGGSSGTTPPSAVQTNGMPSSPTTLLGNPAIGGTGACGGGYQCTAVSGANGTLEFMKQSGLCNMCRASWRQLK